MTSSEYGNHRIINFDEEPFESSRPSGEPSDRPDLPIKGVQYDSSSLRRSGLPGFGRDEATEEYEPLPSSGGLRRKSITPDERAGRIPIGREEAEEDRGGGGGTSRKQFTLKKKKSTTPSSSQPSKGMPARRFKRFQD